MKIKWKLGFHYRFTIYLLYKYTGLFYTNNLDQLKKHFITKFAQFFHSKMTNYRKQLINIVCTKWGE